MLIIERPEIQVYIGTSENIAFSDDFRIAIIKLNALSFQIPHWKLYEFVVAYHNSKNFNVTTPEIGSKFPVIADKIYSLKDRDVLMVDLITLLNPEEQQLIKQLPNGWDCEELIKWRPKIPEGRNFRRTQWRMPLHDCTNAIPIHPDLHRPFTKQEYWLCTESDNAQKLPIPIFNWLLKQVTHYENNDWEADDYESRYDGYSEQWVGKSTPGATVKTFDLTQYYCKQFDPHDYDHIPHAQHLYTPTK